MERKLLCSICDGDKDTPKQCAEYLPKGCCLFHCKRKSEVCVITQGKEYVPCAFHPCELITED